jgi:Tol biopolymer transport system component
MASSGDRKVSIFQAGATGINKVQGQVSPDGRWLAYASNESGRYEVFVQSFLNAGGRWQISKDGAVHPRWRGDSKELFYYGSDSRLMAVTIKGDTALEVGAAVPLFTARMLGGPAVALGLKQQYDVTRDGQRFLLNSLTEEAAPTPITVVLNWTSALKK